MSQCPPLLYSIISGEIDRFSIDFVQNPNKTGEIDTLFTDFAQSAQIGRIIKGQTSQQIVLLLPGRVEESDATVAEVEGGSGGEAADESVPKFRSRMTDVLYDDA